MAWAHRGHPAMGGAAPRWPAHLTGSVPPGITRSALPAPVRVVVRELLGLRPGVGG